MTERSLLPFLEQPSRIDGDHRASRERLARIEYELSTLKTEKRLLQQSKDAAIGRYEELLAKKNDELLHLQNNFDYLFNQRKDLQSKLLNQKEVASASSSTLNSELKSLATENKALKGKLEKYERQFNSISGKCDHLRADLNRELQSNDQFRDRIKEMKNENHRLTKLNDDILERMKALSGQLESNNSFKNYEDLQLRLVSLQKTNNQLQFRVDSLLQQKTSMELLKQKNASLESKISTLERAEEKAELLQLENLELRTKFDEYFGVISTSVQSNNSESTDDSVLKFVQTFKELQNKNLVLFEKLSKVESNVSRLEETNLRLQDEINQELKPKLENLQNLVIQQENEIKELKKQKVLNSKEIEFLRNSLKSLDSVTAHIQATKISAGTDGSSKETEARRQATNQYLSNLEKLVDDYKKEVETLRRNSTLPQSVITPAKRPRLIDEDDTKTRAAIALRNENLELLAEIRTLNDKLNLVTKKLKLAEKATDSTDHILELRSNPFSKDQAIKQETLNRLQDENRSLIAKYVESGNVESVPRAVFARQENDKDVLQAKIDHLTKRIDRLSSVYAEKSKEIIAVISRYFGYKIEFILSPLNPNEMCSKIKLVSKYTTRKDLGVSPPYLTLDVHNKSLKANGTYEFKAMCEELVNQWVNEKNQIPCFLSALNLKLYNEYFVKLSN
ncbi:CIC11C00000003349 [Sungouiella intermedia]|uniref:Spindle assembly checkpoint component MAD1 n=1 Tax=Sungouiella intermedia TaxID=45354 RepID=A0A1L0D9W1_9ASCO|nr:CIC11C00000003349 [[Candida] intermedia]